MQATARRRAREPLYVEKPHLLFSNELNYAFRVISFYRFEESEHWRTLSRRNEMQRALEKSDKVGWWSTRLHAFDAVQSTQERGTR